MSSPDPLEGNASDQGDALAPEDLGPGGRHLSPEAFELVLVEQALADARRALRRAGSRQTPLRREILAAECLLQELWLRAVNEAQRR